jgi:hypothetical protein
VLITLSIGHLRLHQIHHLSLVAAFPSSASVLSLSLDLGGSSLSLPLVVLLFL